MKILYVVTSADRGGAQKYVLTLAEEFGGVIACGASQSWLFNEAERLGIKTIRLAHLKRSINPFYDLLAIQELRRVVAREKPDIVHLNSSKAGVLGSFACRAFLKDKNSGLKAVIYTIHGAVVNEAGSRLKIKFYGFLERLASKYRTHTIAVSKADKAAITASTGLSPDKVTTIHNGLDPIDFLGRSAARQQLNLPLEGFVIGTVANYYTNKGLDTLITAVAQLAPTFAERISAVALLGDGPERSKLNRLISHHELENKVRLIQLETSAARLLKAFDLFVLPSRKEGIPFALLEALQAGLPVIATNVGGVSEVLEYSEYIIEPDKPLLLKSMIERFMSSPEILSTEARASLRRAVPFSRRQMVAQTALIYNKFLSSLDKN